MIPTRTGSIPEILPTILTSLLCTTLVACVGEDRDLSFDETAEQSASNLFLRPTALRTDWSSVYTELRIAHHELQAIFDAGGDLSDGVVVDIEQGEFTLALLADHGPDPSSSGCPSDLASYAWVTPQVETSVQMDAGSLSTMLWKDETDPAGDVCIQVYGESDQHGAACYYQDCLGGGDANWMSLVLKVNLPQGAEHVRAAMDDASAGGGDDVRDAIVYLLRQSAAGSFAQAL